MGWQPGQRIGGFVLRRPLGAGGFGEVWEAQQDRPSRLVAVKFLKGGSDSPVALERFRREADAAGRLAHPGIVSIFSVEVVDGTPFLVQELVPGGRTYRSVLDELIAAPESRGSVPAGHDQRTAEAFAMLADALHGAHQRGVIHRDLKPQNILIAPDGRLRITDFGLAKLVDRTSLTETGAITGTCSYMSPEQALAGRPGLDHRTDVFSLGVMLYESLTLRRPFEADTGPGVLDLIVRHEPHRPRKLRPAIPLDLETICLKCLEKRAGARYDSMAALAADLRRFLAHEPIRARPPRLMSRGAKWLRRHPAMSLTGAGIAAVLVLFLSLGPRVPLLARHFTPETESIQAFVVSPMKPRVMSVIAELGLLQEHRTRFGMPRLRAGDTLCATVASGGDRWVRTLLVQADEHRSITAVRPIVPDVSNDDTWLGDADHWIAKGTQGWAVGLPRGAQQLRLGAIPPPASPNRVFFGVLLFIEDDDGDRQLLEPWFDQLVQRAASAPAGPSPDEPGLPPGWVGGTDARNAYNRAALEDLAGTSPEAREAVPAQRDEIMGAVDWPLRNPRRYLFIAPVGDP